METSVYKFTLSTKKVIYLREPKISDSETAVQLAGMKAGDNMAHLGLITQKELFKKLLVQVDDKKPSMSEKENLDGLFTYKEFNQCMQALQQVVGDDGMGKPELEITSFGDK